MKCYEVTLTGRVQGVGFRWFALRQAQLYGIRGQVRNMPDGSVEVVACGDEPALGIYLSVLRKGPDYGHVTGFHIHERQFPPAHEGFKVVY